jgi:hypothetical protein
VDFLPSVRELEDAGNAYISHESPYETPRDAKFYVALAKGLAIERSKIEEQNPDCVYVFQRYLEPLRDRLAQADSTQAKLENELMHAKLEIARLQEKYGFSIRVR